MYHLYATSVYPQSLAGISITLRHTFFLLKSGKSNMERCSRTQS